METRKRLLQPDDENVTIRQTFLSLDGTDPAPPREEPSCGRDSAAAAARISQPTRSLCPKPPSPQPYRLPLKINFPVSPLFDRSLEASTSETIGWVESSAIATKEVPPFDEVALPAKQLQPGSRLLPVRRTS